MKINEAWLIISDVHWRAKDTKLHLPTDGAEALRMARTDQYEVMLLDVMLPRMDGAAVIRKLREERLKTQAIIVSARDSMSDIVDGLDAGGGRLPD